jgi:hypothetical protein
VQQYDVVRKCKTHWKRKYHYEYYPRGLTTGELMAIQSGLTSIGYDYLINSLDQMAHSFELAQAFPPLKGNIANLN